VCGGLQQSYTSWHHRQHLWWCVRYESCKAVEVLAAARECHKYTQSALTVNGQRSSMVGENFELGLSMHTGSSFLWAARDDSVASWEKSLYPSVDNPDVVAKLQVGFLDCVNNIVNQNNTLQMTLLPQHWIRAMASGRWWSHWSGWLVPQRREARMTATNEPQPMACSSASRPHGLRGNQEQVAQYFGCKNFCACLRSR